MKNVIISTLLTTVVVFCGQAQTLPRLKVSGPMAFDATVPPTIYTNLGTTEANLYFQVTNSPLLAVPAGTKTGGLLVADDFAYANPNKNQLIVKTAMGINTTLASNPNNYTLWANGKVNATAYYINDQMVVSSQWVTSGTNIYYAPVNGNVGIGTTLNDNPRGYKLAVGGKIGAQEVRVEKSSTTWPDYVFAPEYTLPSWQELEAYIRINRHLKDVPAAAEVEQEGHDLGSMDAVLLKKIEELTLYMIELKKENEALKQRMEAVEKR
jgi:hypothetical protein